MEMLALFREKLQLFTTQKSNLLFYHNSLPFIKMKKGYAVDTEHQFFKEYPMCLWFGHIIFDSFAKHFHSSFESNELATQQFVQDIQNTVDSKLNALFPGLNFDLITEISCEKYEKVASKGLYATIIPGTFNIAQLKSKFPCTFVPLSNIECSTMEPKNIHGIRKLLNMTLNGDSCLIFVKNGAVYKAVGLGDRQKCRELFPCVRFSAHAEWELCFPPQMEEWGFEYKDSKNTVPGYSAGCRLKNKLGRFYLPTVDLKNGEINYLIHQLKLNDNCARKVGVLLSRLKALGSGATVIIGNKNILKAERKRLCNDAKLGILTGENDHNDYIDLCNNDTNLLRHLTAIGGALFVDYDLKCYACGVILDGNAHPGIGNISRGARYNSANNYLETHNKQQNDSQCKLIGLVVSDDGMSDIFPDIKRIC